MRSVFVFLLLTFFLGCCFIFVLEKISLAVLDCYHKYQTHRENKREASANSNKRADVIGAEELKPCPFCGEIPELRFVRDIGIWRYGWQVRCCNKNCSATVQTDYHCFRSIAIKDWNERKEQNGNSHIDDSLSQGTQNTQPNGADATNLCPFCGIKPVIWNFNHPYRDKYNKWLVMCVNPKCKIRPATNRFQRYKSDAVKLWNNRKAMLK